MLRTRVGYAGGTTPNPTYHNLGDHTECVQMDYDANRVSYQELLSLFWQGHDPSARFLSRQYRSLILTHSEDQIALAQASKVEVERASGQTIQTAISPAGTFFLAEAYHQKFYLRRANAIMVEMEKRYPRLEQLVGSMDAARLNGYVAGHGTQARLEQELPSFGLSASAAQRLGQIVAGFGR